MTEKEWEAKVISKPVEEVDLYFAKMTKGPDIPLNERDLGLIKRAARRGFKNPIHKIFSKGSQKPDQLINFNKMVCVRKDGNYDDTIKEWKKLTTRCTVVVETGPNLMITDKDFVIINNRSARFDVTRIVELSGEIDGVIILNLNHVIHAYKRTYETLMTKEKFAEMAG
jgi:hypothetical protein